EIRSVVAGRLIACPFQPQLGGDVALVCALRGFALVEAAVARTKIIDDRRAERVRPVRHRLLPAHILVITEGRPARRADGGDVRNDVAAVDSVLASERVVPAPHELIVSGALWLERLIVVERQKRAAPYAIRQRNKLADELHRQGMLPVLGDDVARKGL